MSERFTKLDGGGITWYKDNKTGLEWSETAPRGMAVNEAIEWCMSIGGTLPTIKELLTLVDYSMFNPCTSLESTRYDCYWSASTYAPFTHYAWAVSFFDGVALTEDSAVALLVRAVRGGKG